MYVFAGICCQSSCGTECGAQSQVQIYNPEANMWRVGEPTPWQVSIAIFVAKRCLLLVLHSRNGPAPNLSGFLFHLFPAA